MSIRHGADPALETLFLPFAAQQLAWPAADILFLRARPPLPIDSRAVICTNGFKPQADALASAGYEVLDEERALARHYSMILLLPPRQRDEARALMARALLALDAGGRLVVAAANNEGARSVEADLAMLAGPVNSLSKQKCRACWTAPLQQRDSALASEWRALDRVRPIDGDFVSRPGVFAWNRIDPASALLASHLPPDLSGQAADLGAGFGYLSTQLLQRCSGIKRLDVYEAEQRALELARVNLGTDTPVQLKFYWHDVTRGLLDTYDVIVSNPPFHAGSGVDRPDIGRRFIAAAADSLRPGGRLWLVANRHLPYESVLDRHFGRTRIVTQENGYKIIEAVKASAAK